jgi:hypothetical protein
MELFSTPAALDDFLLRSETVEGNKPLRVTRPEEFRAEVVDSLVWTAVFGQPSVRDSARRAIREAAGSVGILPASILPLYKARGRGEVSGFTVPAVNLRMLTTWRAPLRAAQVSTWRADLRDRAQRISHTDQRPASTPPSSWPRRSAKGGTGRSFSRGTTTRRTRRR